MSTSPIKHPALARIAAHRPLHPAACATLNLITHPALLVLGLFVSWAAIATAILDAERFVFAPIPFTFLVAVFPAAALIHYITSTCSVDQLRTLKAVANEDPYAGPFVRGWIDADHVPCQAEAFLVERYLSSNVSPRVAEKLRSE